MTSAAEPGRVVVVGGGIGGAAAAHRLARRGLEVQVVERGDRLGGLVASFEVAGTPLECFYHHVFPHERDIQALIAELDLGNALEWHPSTVGVFRDGKVWPFTSPLDLLRFSPLPFLARLRTGIGALRLGRVSQWESLDTIPARDWLAEYTGPEAAEVIWDPLLRAKFGPAAPGVPAAWMWARFRQRAGARKGGGERLGYLRGGFRQLFDRLAEELDRLGAVVRLGDSVERIDVDAGRVQGVTLGSGEAMEADAVVFTGPLPVIRDLVGEEAGDVSWADVPYLGVLCVVLECRRRVNDVYWTNVCDPDLSFGGVIEHTNLIPPSDYGDRHILYLSRYFVHEEAIAAADPAVEADAWIDQMDQRWPGFRRDDVLTVHPFRTPFAAPLVQVGYADLVPPMSTAIQGLHVATTAQIYPEDRGMDEAVKLGGTAADVVARALAHR